MRLSCTGPMTQPLKGLKPTLWPCLESVYCQMSPRTLRHICVICWHQKHNQFWHALCDRVRIYSQLWQFCELLWWRQWKAFIQSDRTDSNRLPCHPRQHQEIDKIENFHWLIWIKCPNKKSRTYGTSDRCVHQITWQMLRGGVWDSPASHKFGLSDQVPSHVIGL